jgi:hypothetical protein
MTHDSFFEDAARRKKWERMAPDWANAEAPAIPSKGDVAIFTRQVSTAFGATGGRAAIILGATWRLRQIFLDNLFEDAPIYCVDWSEKMYQINTTLLGRTPKLETFVNASWTQYQLEKKVPVILGDKILDNLPFNEWPTFFDRAAEHLVSGGRLVLHCAPIVDIDTPPRDPNDYLAKWAAFRNRNEVTVEDAASGFWEDLLTSSASLGSPDDKILTISKHESELKSLCPNDPFSTEILAVFYKIFGPSIADTWCAYSQRDIEIQSSERFHIVDVEHADDYKAAAQQPIISLKRR